MAPFRFRLERVRLYRKQLEEQAMQALALAIMHRDALLERIAVLARTAAEQRARMCRPEAMEAAERWLTQSYLDALALDINIARQQLADAEEHMDACRIALVERAKERGLLDTLREKQMKRHLLLERQQERKSYDETATLRYKPATI